jgi:tetratricopeptide (TPR) repeat protein
MAPRLLAALFADGGAKILADGALGSTWQEALAHVPTQVLQVPEQAAGLRQLSRLRDFWSSADDLRPALAASRALLELRHRVVGPDHPDTWMEVGALGALVERAGRPDEGGRLLEQAYEGLRRHKVDDLRLALVSANLGKHRIAGGDDAGGEACLREAFALQRRLAPKTAGLVGAQLAELYLRLGRGQEALPLLKEAYDLTKAAYGPEHPRTLARALSLGLGYASLERWEQAVVALRVAHAARQRQPMDEEGAAVAFELGVALSRSGQLEEGLRCVDAAVRWTRAEGSRAGESLPTLPSRLAELSRLQLLRGRVDEAHGLLLEALDVERRLSGDDAIEVAGRMLDLGRFAMHRGDLAEALGWIEPAASLHRSILGDAHEATKVAVEAQLELLVQQAQTAGRDKALARELLSAGVTAAGPVLGYVHPKVRAARDRLDALR